MTSRCSNDRSVGEWAERLPLTLDGRPFTFNRHEYLLTPYADNHHHIVEMKAAQMGLTSKAMLTAIYKARYEAMRGILYLFPSKSDVTDFVKGRVDPLIEDNYDTFSGWLKETNSANVKRVWQCLMYFRGMRSALSLKSIPVDWVIYDELDEAPQHMIDMAQERMSHATDALGNPIAGMDWKLSNPTLPDYGIDLFFQKTDQRYWHIKCEACGEYTCMEEGFPSNPRDEVECLKEIGGVVVRVCKKCEREINPSIGEWVAKQPSVTDLRGYHYSQLFSHFVDMGKLLYQFRTTDNYKAFYNLKLGMPYVEAENRLSIEQVLALCGNEGIASSDSGPCYMGVDQGKDLHVVIGKRGYESSKINYISIHKEWEELDVLMKIFNVSRCVVDAQPAMENARKFAGRFPGKVFLNFYKETQRGRYSWNERDMTVSCNRTESLDASHNQILNGSIILPRRDIEVVKTFAKHLHDVGKKLEEDEESGSKRYIYVKLGSKIDHFRHAFNYEEMARTYGSTGMFGGCDLS